MSVRIPHIGLLTISLLVFGITSSVDAQIDYAVEQRSTCARLVERPKNYRPISAGVVNGKALYLAKPNYPHSARELRVRGQIQVSILIDPCGCVAEASALSGHPMLRTSAIQAAKNSLFSPVVIGDAAVWVHGVIVYNFLSNERNWLELGYSHRGYADLINYLPTGFDEERAILRQIEFAGWEEREKSLKDVRTQIETKLRSDRKSGWLFALGIWLSEMKAAGWNDAIRDENFRGMHLANAPDDISPDLLRQLRDLSSLKGTVEIRRKINEIIDRMFYFGQ